MTVTTIGRNVIWGVTQGAIMALAYSILALIIYAVLGNYALHTPGLTIGAVLISYWVGGLTAGCLIGLLRPLSRFNWGPYVIGAIAGTAVFAAFQASDLGPMWRWSLSAWTTPLILGTIMGCLAASDSSLRDGIQIWPTKRNIR